MADILLDTNVFAEFLAQFFDPASADRGYGVFRPQGFMSSTVATVLNRLKADHLRFGDIRSGIVVVSAFGVIELSRKWRQIVGTKLTIIQLHSFILQPPEWVSIAPVDDTLIPFFMSLPTHIVTTQGHFKALEWTDAIHVATAVSRGEGIFIGATDGVIRSLALGGGRQCI